MTVLIVLYVISRYNYNLFHSLADGVSIVTAASVFTIIWNSRRLVDNHFFLFIGIAFLFFALLDLIHMLGNRNMGVFPEYGNLGPAFYIVTRYLLSLSFLIAPLFINRRLNLTLMYAAYSLATALVLLSVFYWQNFPVCFVEGVGLTPFKVVSDYVICLILLGAIGMLLVNRRSFEPKVLRLIVSSLALSIATGLTFTLYTDPFGITNTVGHFFQIASFYLVYLAFIDTSLTKPHETLFRRLKQNEEMLAQSVRQLDVTNSGLKREIVEREKAQKLAEEKQIELERINRDLESFSYSVSHDLRAPLRAITGYLQMILKKQGESLDEETQRRFRQITDIAATMGRLIDDLLAFSRLGNQPVTKRSLDMEALGREAWQELAEIHPDREMALKIGPMPAAWGDQALIRQVYCNLLGNAVKFTQKRAVAHIEVGSCSQDGETVYYVRDNGVGFDMQYGDKLFGVFQRLHDDAEYKGSGIGLALIKRIVNRHGGQVWAEGRVDEGATFFFTLPGGETSA